MIIIPHHPSSPNFFIENPTKNFLLLLFFWITYMHSNYTTSIYPFSLEASSMFIFGGSKNGKSSKIKLIIYIHTNNSTSWVLVQIWHRKYGCSFGSLNSLKTLILIFELREALVLGHNCTSAKWVNILHFKSFPWENLKFSTPSSPILKNPWASFPSVFVFNHTCFVSTIKNIISNM